MELEIAVLVLGEVIVRSIIKFDLQVAEVKFVLHNLAVEVFESRTIASDILAQEVRNELGVKDRWETLTPFFAEG